MNTFQDDIKDLIEVTIDHAVATLEQKGQAVYFIGRETCPYCRKFATKLGKVVAATKSTVYFVNSEKADQLSALADFRGKHGIPTVPGFVNISNGEITVRCDSSMTEEEIKAFMAH